MSAPKRLGLRAQILLGLALVTLFAVLSTGYLALWAGGESLRVQRETAAITIATTAARALETAIDPGQPLGAKVNRDRLEGVVMAMTAGLDDLGVKVIDRERQTLVAQPPDLASDGELPIALAVLLSGIPPVSQYQDRDGRTELFVYAPLIVNLRTLGAVRVSIPAPSPVTDVLDRSGLLLLGLAIGNALLVIALGFFVLTYLVVRPLQSVERATARVSAGDWEQRLEPEGAREVAALASAFNQMTSSLATQREQLIRTEKLASVGQLAAGVAHEIGNPLAAVLGFVDILRMDAGHESRSLLSAAERRDTLDRVKSETQRINRIIQDLLAYSRPSREEAQPTDLRTVLRAALALLAPQARFRGVRVEIADGEGTEWPLAQVSPGRLSQVLVNLLLNAADAMGGQGVISIRCDRREGQVELRVSDEGAGVPAELRPRIFDPFFTTKPPGQGTGLGLSISRSIVESYGGTLELAPSNRGATFVVALPAADGAGATGG